MTMPHDTTNSDTPDDEDELWNEMMEDVTPLSERPNKVIKKSARNRSSSKEKSDRQPKTPYTNTPARQTHAKDLDGSTQQKLIRGKIPIEARIDLHGMTQEQAHARLIPFITRSYEDKKRCVLVITGKGQGILQSQTPQWLNSYPIDNMVLKAVQAQPKDGGSGALYVYLRRQR